MAALTLTTTLRADFHVLNAKGVVVFTSSDDRIAVGWAKSKADELGALVVDHVTTQELRQRVYRPRPRAALQAEGSAA